MNPAFLDEGIGEKHRPLFGKCKHSVTVEHAELPRSQIHLPQAMRRLVQRDGETLVDLLQAALVFLEA